MLHLYIMFKKVLYHVYKWLTLIKVLFFFIEHQLTFQIPTTVTKERAMVVRATTTTPLSPKPRSFTLWPPSLGWLWSLLYPLSLSTATCVSEGWPGDGRSGDSRMVPRIPPQLPSMAACAPSLSAAGPGSLTSPNSHLPPSKNLPRLLVDGPDHPLMMKKVFLMVCLFLCPTHTGTYLV